MLKAVLHRRYHSALFRCSQNSYLSAKDFENSHSVLSASSVGAAIGSAADTKSRTFADNVSQVQIKLGINLSRYGVNLSKLAVEDKLDQVIGREEEINKAIKILSRRRKNNPCLIGDAGVGKSAVAEGLARMIAAGDVPESMKDKVIISLDLAGLLAGTKLRGEFEDRLKGVIKDVELLGDRVILFIDEMHQLVGAGGADGAIDASNILKPSLARGQLRCMGATTTEEYGKYIEKDASLARRFQPVYVSEPTDEHTEVILKGLRHRYEIHHRVRIDDSAIKAAIKLARKYLPHLRFPDKAIDLIDEAAATVRNRNESKSDLFRQVEERLSELRQQLSKLEESGSKTSAENIRLQTEIAGLCSQGVELAQSLIQQQELVKDVFELEKNMERLRQHLAHERTKTEADVQGQQKSAAELADNANSVEKLYTQLQKQYGYDNRITDKAIAKVICDNTGIPTDVMLGDGEKERLLNMEKELKKRIVGQDNALKTIAKCIRLSSAGLRYHDRPLGVFLLLGSTGVGKTELAKAVAEFLFQSSSSSPPMLRIDMSEYMEKFSVSRLIGAPPGYVGYEEGGILTEAVRRRPYQVILLDEFEKAHREVSNLLLQVFDEGHLTDSHGMTTDFRNTVIFMTSNLGSKELFQAQLKKTEMDDSSKESKDHDEVSLLAQRIVHGHFSPEFANRLDDVIVFNGLNDEALRRICHIQLNRACSVLRENHNVSLLVTDVASKLLAQWGGGSEYGARPLKRVIQNQLMTPLAVLILENKVQKGDTILVADPQETGTVQIGSNFTAVIDPSTSRQLVSDTDNDVSSASAKLKFWVVSAGSISSQQ